MTSALLVIDVQHLLCNGDEAAHDIERVIERINALAARARAAGAPVFLIQHEDDGPLRHDSEGWQLDRRLSAQPDDVRMRKTATDSFHHTKLQSLLDARCHAPRGVRPAERLLRRHDGAPRARARLSGDAGVRRALDHGQRHPQAAQIIAHHSRTLSNIDSFGPRVTPLTPTGCVSAPERTRCARP